MTRHVGAHAADADECDGGRGHGGEWGRLLVISNQWSVLFEFGVEGVVGFFFGDGGVGAVAGAEDGGVGEGEDFLAVGGEGVGVGDHAAAHGGGEEGVADDGNGVGEAGDDVGNAAAGVAVGGAGLDFE